RGHGFALTAHDKEARAFAVRGHAVGGMAAVWIEEEVAEAKAGLDFRAILDAVPVPIWLRDRTLSLVWGNKTFFTASGAKDGESAIAAQTALDRSERDLAATARNQGAMHEARRFAVVAGQRRALAFTETPLDGLGGGKRGRRHRRRRRGGKASAAYRRPCRYARQARDRRCDLRPRSEDGLLQSG